MEKKPFAFVEAGKSVSAFWNKTKETVVKVVDQNGDGEISLDDASVIAEAIGVAAKNTAVAVRDSAEAKSREIDLKMLQPIFFDDLDSPDFSMSKLIRITEIDKRRAESEVCQGSIGFTSVHKDLRIVNIFRDTVDSFGLTFFPDMDSELYYVDPCDRDRYIALDDYFSYMKIARVSELQKIAQDLGAKHFRLTYMEHKKTFSGGSVKGKAGVKGIGNATAEHDHSISEASAIEVAAEMDCPGHAPIRPTLHYLQRDPSIDGLIRLRLDEHSPITHHKLTLNFSQTSGIKEKDAVKIDAALKSMKFTGNTTVTSEARNEARRFFEYEVDF